MDISFDFDARKAARAIAYLVSKMPGQKVDKVKVMKLLYLADRDHFLREGRPITGDDQYAMPFGPVPTLSLNLLDGQFEQNEDGEIFDYLETIDFMVRLKKLPAPLELSDSELKVLDAVVERYGAVPKWELVDWTHKLPEYCQVFRPKTSTRIPFELLLKIYSQNDLFRHNRVVITSGMATHMSCPFSRAEDDL
jgi:uncharacterized phage-associated protein